MNNKRVMRFIGVSTSGSSINKVFPKWSEILGLDAELIGLDIPIGAPASTYRNAISQMQEDKNCAGALVTTHKIALYAATNDMFKSLDTFATACGEISSIKITNGDVNGSAKDPITAGLALAEFLDIKHFENGAEVICFGDGGAATAIAWHLSGLEIPPAKIYFYGKSQERLNHLQKVVKVRPGSDCIEIKLSSESEIIESLKKLPKNSLIINATGMGKDLPGSPMPPKSHFPRDSIIWELNYRGELDFIKKAKLESTTSNLKVYDGWRYFIHGWSNVIAEVFDVALTSNLLNELSIAAEIAR